MKPGTPKLETDTLALFTVSADSELSSMAASACAYVPGIEFAGEFHSYITGNRRPAFPPVVKQALSSIALIDFDRNSGEATETAHALSGATEHRIIAIGVSSQLTADLLLHAMRAGCSEFLQKPIDSAHLHEVLQRWQARLTVPSAAPGQCGKLIALFGVKGGVGTTSLAVHLAVELAQKQGKKVLLVDHHQQLGHVCLYLGISDAPYHFSDLMGNIDQLDSDLLDGLIIKHSSGLHVLASPDLAAAGVTDGGPQTSIALEFLRGQYDFVLVDSDLRNQETSRAVLEAADEAVIISTPDVAAVRDLSRHLAQIQAEPELADKVRPVINRVASGTGVDLPYIEKAIGKDTQLSIPNYHPQVSMALDAGRTVGAEKRNVFSTRISEWAKKLCATDPANEQKSATKKFLGIW